METIQKITKYQTLLEKVRILLCISILIGIYCVHAQSQSFSRQYIDELRRGSGGVAVAVTDVNLDGLEDIVRFNNARELQILLQLPDGEFEMHESFAPLVFRQWNILGLPLNEDRWLDWISAGNDSGVNYWISDSIGGYEYLLDNRYKFFAQGSNAIDFDESGSLDIFMCSDLSENYTLKNEDGIPFDRERVLPPSHPDSFFRSGNYGSVWEDINEDGKPDLYISKCSIFANHPSDPRRINQFYISQPDGSYIEVAQEWNIADSAQSWASAFADVDNDGLMDLLVINHDEPAALYMNQGDEFQKSQAFEELNLQFNSVQVLARDFDCDGHVDFLITGERATILLNDQEGGFSEHADLLGRYQNSISSAQIGDFNQDGYLDIFSTRHGLYNNPQDRDDILLLNPFSSTKNNFIRFQIVDSSYFKMSGTQVEVRLYSDLGMQRRTLRVGESYGVCGSNILHFGIGEDSAVDSVVFTWPGGKKESYIPPQVNTLFLYTAGVGMRAERELEFANSCFSVGDTTRILGIDPRSDDLRLYYNENEWNYGENQGVSEEGRYFWIDRDSSGAWFRASPLYLSADIDIDSRLNFSGELEVCGRDALFLEPLNSEHFLFWNTGEMNSTLMVEEPGLFQAIFSHCGDTVLSEWVDVDYRPDITIRAINDTVGIGTRAMLRAVGSDINWYEFEDSEVPLQRGSGLFIISQLDRDTVLFAESQMQFERKDLNVGPLISEENSALPNPWFNAQIEFTALSDCRLKEITVRAVEAGRREFILRNLDGQVIERSGFSLDSHTIHKIDLGWNLSGGTSYVLTTDGAINFSEFDFSGPQLYQVDQDSFDYPYTDGEYISITGTNGGIDEFYYYSNWVIEVPPDTCASERVPVRGIIDSSLSGSSRAGHSALEVFPNPAADFVMVKVSGIENGLLQFRSADGRKVFEGVMNRGAHRIPCHSWPAGMYIAHFEQGNTSAQKLVFIVR